MLGYTHWHSATGIPLPECGHQHTGLDGPKATALQRRSQRVAAGVVLKAVALAVVGVERGKGPDNGEDEEMRLGITEKKLVACNN